jgi:hypothetical protein
MYVDACVCGWGWGCRWAVKCHEPVSHVRTSTTRLAAGVTPPLMSVLPSPSPHIHPFTPSITVAVAVGTSKSHGNLELRCICVCMYIKLKVTDSCCSRLSRYDGASRISKCSGRCATFSCQIESSIFAFIIISQFSILFHLKGCNNSALFWSHGCWVFSDWLIWYKYRVLRFK